MDFTVGISLSVSLECNRIFFSNIFKNIFGQIYLKKYLLYIVLSK